MAGPKPNRERQQVHEPEPASPESVGTRLSAHEIYENINAAAEEELERPAPALLWSAIAAGLTIGFSFFATGYLSSLVPERFAVPARAVGYPLGFIFVVLARNQLSTENTFEPIIPCDPCAPPCPPSRRRSRRGGRRPHQQDAADDVAEHGGQDELAEHRSLRAGRVGRGDEPIDSMSVFEPSTCPLALPSRLRARPASSSVR